MIYEFVFKDLPNLLDLEDVDEDRLFELQRNVQEQLCKRDEEREKILQRESKNLRKHLIL